MVVVAARGGDSPVPFWGVLLGARDLSNEVRWERRRAILLERAARSGARGRGGGGSFEGGIRMMLAV